MDIINSVIGGFAVVTDPANLAYVVGGVVIGMLVGVLPGLGPSASIALLLPLTYEIPPEGAIIMLAGIYYGAYYGGTVTSVVLRLPGEAASIVTTFDGYQMALRGRAGAALGISAIGSFVGGISAVIGLMLLAPVLANVALEFGPPEYVALAILGLVLTTVLDKSFLKGVIAVGLGLLIASVGIDSVSGASRFTFSSTEMLGGIDLIAVAMGMFGIGDILYNLEREGRFEGITGRVNGIWPTKEDRRRSRGAIARGSVLGFVLGLVPGGGGVMASLSSYAVERRIAKDPERFGKGAIEGVAGPETANNAGATSAFIPLLTLGIPSNVVLALLYGALLIHGVTPGPDLVTQHPDIFWGVICSMVIGNFVLLLLSLPFVRVFVQLVRIRLGVLASIIVIITMAAIFSVSNSVFDMWVMLAFGIVGYLMRKADYPAGPLVLALVLGPLLEDGFRQSMLMSDGSLAIFVERPIPLFILALTVVGLTTVAVRARHGSRRSNDPSVTTMERPGVR